MSDPAKYIVGWICAIATEYVAAQEFLDEEHDGPIVSSNDPNDYTLGRIGEHNVVIAVLPDGEYGTASAASVATNMLNSFPNVRIGLMVGIGGGVPSEKHDIRLGDVVVSAPRNGEGGVFQYDFGKSIQGESFQYTRFLNQPPTSLRTAMTGIQAQYRRNGHQLKEAINTILEKNARLRQEYERPQPSTDRLFKAQIRTEHEDNPAIHYGLIASADQLMKNALIRDRLAAEKDVICFEMEAAGLINHFPCLVIRGICDYSDSHKNKGWQGYAAMVAAAYAKDLLHRIIPNRIVAEKRIGDVLSGLKGVAEAHKAIAQKHLEIQESTIEQKWLEKQEECLQSFRLTTGTKDATYEWYKNHVGIRVEGTCEWFLNHDNFQKWLEQDSGPLLVSADPGCGKSVLAKHLIDDKLPRTATVCYFFFKDQDQNTVRQALCALLHQFLSQKPSLIDHAMDEFSKNGQKLINSTNSLWKIFGEAIRDHQAGPIIIVLDALDECAEAELEDLILNVECQFRNNQLGRRSLKYLLTSHPYEQILSKFRGLVHSFPTIRIPGEEESESIGQEVNHVIEYRVEKLARERSLSDLVKGHLAKRLLEVPHRTYLWVYLVFNYLRTENFKKTPKGIDATFESLPKDINETYERILQKSTEHAIVRRTLSVILAASRPLKLSEMNVALNVESTSKSIHDLDLEESADFRARLRTCCGLFISIHHDKIYLIHQTAREFLLTHAPSAGNAPKDQRWQQSIAIQDAHKVLAGICVFYLDFFNNDSVDTDACIESDQYNFLDYSAKNWGTHCRQADYESTRNFTSFLVSSYFGLEAVVMVLFERDAEFESEDSYGRTPLLWAARNGHETIVKLLLEKGAKLESRDNFSRTPLLWAAVNGHEATVKLLLENGADYKSKDNHGRTLLSFSAEDGLEASVKLLLEKDADFESKDKEYGRTPLSWAAEKGHEVCVKLLLDKGADHESKDKILGRTPFSFAVRSGHKAVVKLLLDKGADFKSKTEEFSQTPLSWAAGNGYDAIVKLLLEKGADFESKNNLGRTPLSIAIRSGYEAVVKMLLEYGAEFESKDKIYGRTPLSWAAGSGHEAIVELLLKKGADFESKDNDGWTPLLWAARKGHEAILKPLLENGADFESKDNDDWTPLMWAARNGHEASVKLLLEQGADLESKDKDGWTPLSWAAGSGHEAIVELLLGKGAHLESEDNDGQTPLSRAMENGNEAISKLLLDRGAEFSRKIIMTGHRYHEL
ncbi:hypothetical protein N7507_008465 [Penicillium longicatenatum]|nr:hypothetical protein N7507_008465 [Penicillium longicatenatum]